MTCHTSKRLGFQVHYLGIIMALLVASEAMLGGGAFTVSKF